MTRFSMVFRLSVVAASFGLLSSCATLNEEQCATTDWTQLGEQDGAAGRQASYVDQHRQACERHGLPVDQTAWQSGWQRGIAYYCTPRNGLIQGREGRSYANSCPLELKAGFEGAYYVAKRLFDARQSRERIEAEIAELERQRDEAEDREARRELRREIEDKRDSIWSADRKVYEAQREYELYILTNNLAAG